MKKNFEQPLKRGLNQTRRSFIGGLSAFGALGGFGTLKAEDGRSLLRVGVLSDIHVEEQRSARCFEDALREFSRRNVDAVSISGDLAQFGFVEELELVRDAWYRVFPDDRRPDGAKVERLFIYGNHDIQGSLYWNNIGVRKYPDPAERARHLIVTDPKAVWERVFHEPYEPIWIRNVRGYFFVGANWHGYAGVDGTEAFLAAHRGELAASRPFFWLAHQHPKDTCHGVQPDDGRSTRALSAFPNAIALTGHSHLTLADERSIWQGAFTSINTASLQTAEYAADVEGVPEGYENGRTPGKARDRDGEKLSPEIVTRGFPQGMVMDVYADRTEFVRLDFLTGKPLGENWVVPHAAVRPYGQAERARKSAVPRFAPAADLRVDIARAKNRSGVLKDVYEVKFPAAGGVRARSYEVRVESRGDGRTLACKRVIAEGFNRPLGCAAEGVCRFDVASLPTREHLSFAVSPVNCFGVRGPALKGR